MGTGMVMGTVMVVPNQILILIQRKKRQSMKMSHERISCFYSVSSAKHSLERISKALRPVISG